MNRTQVTYNIGRCPACHTEVRAVADVALDSPTGQSPPDPRQEGAVKLDGKIIGAEVVAHDCRKRATR